MQLIRNSRNLNKTESKGTFPTQMAVRKRGRPKGSKNKPKSGVEPPDREPLTSKVRKHAFPSPIKCPSPCGDDIFAACNCRPDCSYLLCFDHFENNIHPCEAKRKRGRPKGSKNKCNTSKFSYLSFQLAITLSC